MRGFFVVRWRGFVNRAHDFSMNLGVTKGKVTEYPYLII
jgi:hypothetical protein